MYKKEKIINFKAKKKDLIFKTKILDNFVNDEFSSKSIKILANGFFFVNYNQNMEKDIYSIYDKNFIEVFNSNDYLFQMDEYTFCDSKNNIIRFNKQYKSYSILYNIDENLDLDFIFKLDNNKYIFKINEDLVILEEGESNIFNQYKLSNFFENYKYNSKNIIYFTFNNIKFGLYISDTFIIFGFKDKTINILNKKSIKLKIYKMIMAKENIIIFLCKQNYESGYSIYTFNIETMEIISIFNFSDETKNNHIYFSLDDINAFKFMRIIDEDLYNKYHKFIQNKKKVLKIIFIETNINKLDDDVVTNYQIYYIMSNYLIIKGPIINIGSFCSLYYDKQFATEEFNFYVGGILSWDEIEDVSYSNDYAFVKYRKFLSNNLKEADFDFLFDEKAIIFYAEGEQNCQHLNVFALSYIKFK